MHVLERTLPLGQKFLYAPEITVGGERNRWALVHAARELAQAQRAFVVRLEFFEEWDDGKAAILSGLGLTKAFEEVQPEYRQWIPLEKNEDHILAQMKPKGRYNIRLATRHGVEIATERNIDKAWPLFEETATRDGFGIRTKTYYEELLNFLSNQKLGNLYVATWEGQPLAAAIISFYEGIASYLYGASSSQNRQVMAPYLLHWQAMQDAKSKNCHTYDLLAVAPPQNNQHSDGRHQALQKKYRGITRFKQQFGGETVRLLGSWDLVKHPLIYTGFKLAEQFRRR